MVSVDSVAIVFLYKEDFPEAGAIRFGAGLF
jgi:hypothetical protein